MNSTPTIKLKSIHKPLKKGVKESHLTLNYSSQNILNHHHESKSKVKRIKIGIFYFNKHNINPRKPSSKKTKQSKGAVKAKIALRDIDNFPNTFLIDREHKLYYSNKHIHPLKGNLCLLEKDNPQPNRSTIKLSGSVVTNKRSTSPHLRKCKVLFDFNRNSNAYHSAHINNSNSNTKDKERDSNSDCNISFISHGSERRTIKPITIKSKKYIDQDNKLFRKSVVDKRKIHYDKEDYIINNLIKITKDLKKSSTINSSKDIAFSRLNEYRPLREFNKSNSIMFNDYYSPKMIELPALSLTLKKNRNQNNRYDINEYSNASNAVQLKNWIQKKETGVKNSQSVSLSPCKSQSYWCDNHKKGVEEDNVKFISNNFLKNLLVQHRPPVNILH